MTAVPDSELARKAEQLLRAASTPALANHCLRSFHWATALAALDRVDFDAELLFVAAALHDLGLVDQFDTGESFERDSAIACETFASQNGWPPRRSATAGEAIILHMASQISREDGAAAYLLWHATGLDVVGSRIGELPPALIRHVVSEYPRLDFASHFGSLFADQAKRKPASSTARAVGAGLLDRLQHCPLNHIGVPGSSHEH